MSATWPAVTINPAEKAAAHQLATIWPDMPAGYLDGPFVDWKRLADDAHAFALPLSYGQQRVIAVLADIASWFDLDIRVDRETRQELLNTAAAALGVTR